MAEPPDPQPNSPVTPFIYRRISFLAYLLCLAWILFMAIEFSGSYLQLAGSIHAGVAGIWAILWAVLWIFRLAFYCDRVRAGRQQDNRNWRHWCLEPATCLVMIVLAGTGSLTRLRLFLSARALEQYAQDLLHQRAQPFTAAEGGHWVGLYYIHAVEVVAPGQVYLALEPGLFADSGLGYVSEGELQPVSKNSEAEHLFGPWWLQDRHQSLLGMIWDEKGAIVRGAVQWLSSSSP